MLVLDFVDHFADVLVQVAQRMLHVFLELLRDLDLGLDLSRYFLVRQRNYLVGDFASLVRVHLGDVDEVLFELLDFEVQFLD